jgi:[ribosomal protein S18]-alanine N-acetyltransferase
VTQALIESLTDNDKADVEALAELHGRCFAQGWQADGFARLLRAEATLALLARAPETGAMLGFVLGQHAVDEAEVLTIAVAPEARRQGTGRFLMDNLGLLAASRGAERLYLDVAADNLPAIGLYRVLGFRETGRRRGYYTIGPEGSSVDAVLMMRELE